MRQLVIVGAGGHGRELLDIVHAVNLEHPTFEFMGFLDDREERGEELERRRARVIGPVDLLATLEVEYSIGLGSAEGRRRVDETATGHGRTPATLVHPASTTGSDVHLGPGAVLAAGARITTNVVTGRHVHLNVNATVSHDCHFGDYVTLSPGSHLSGSCRLGDDVLLGSGAVTVQGVSVGRGTVIGAGGCVIRDVPADVVAAGVPVRVLRRGDHMRGDGRPA